ncbi:MAG: acyl-ACP--UDP-N-acetylglucosamine O-acyltransferase [Bacteroidaceae bacterium]|nr:acyl-ACP--UDP-N-acetylglucosamine O-acyltransferase [Bacteroidaceae bacterium]MBR1800799.1 acyl-ACP--UDP-N-acetylglucosamine O-acyltransferase [Bacteroidaceae bacterium]
MISPLAYIDPAAKIGDNVEIGPFCYIDKNVEIGDNNTLMNSVTILSGARIGNGNTFHPGCVISGVPQDLKFRGEESLAIIGDNNKIRENVTINRGTASKGKTVVGSGNLFMEGAHIAHDDVIGNDIIIGNCSKLAGEVTVDDHAILSACVLVHQFCRIGGYTMVGGGTGAPQSVLPYTICARHPATYCGLNIVGLRRRGFDREVINTIHEAYRIIYQGGMSLADALATIRQELPLTPEIKYILDFIEDTKQRGFVH